jgi:exodeoxyribonuclease-3
MRVLTLNLNGLRSATSKGFLPWVAAQDVDVILLQETRLQDAQRAVGQFEIPGYHSYWHDAQAKGYSGVGIYTRLRPDVVRSGLDWPEFDQEGRWIEAHFGQLRLVSLYLPSGSSGELRQQFKFVAMARLRAHLDRIRGETGMHTIIGGDWNIAHRAIDLKNWRSNQKNSGFLPEERAWMDALLEPAGWVDTHRSLHPEKVEYTWWSNRGQAYANDVGWRIDYQIVTPGLRNAAREATVYREPRFSDHAPLIVDYVI